MNVKKQIATFFVFVLVFANMAFHIKAHFCHSALPSLAVHVFSNAENCNEKPVCACAVENENSSCCTDLVVENDIDLDPFGFQNVDLPVFVQAVFKTEVKQLNFIENEHFVQTNFSKNKHRANAPPPYILFSQQLFYDI